MKTFRHVLFLAAAGAVCSASPTGAKEPRSTEADDSARREVVIRYFAQPAAAEAEKKPDRTDPKWVESMRRVLKDLSDDNAQLRDHNEQLRAENEMLKRQLALQGQNKPNGGVFVLPPEALRDLQVPQGQAPRGSGQVPPGWRPFEFNGATYYIIPLRDKQNAAQGQANIDLRTLPASK